MESHSSQSCELHMHPVEGYGTFTHCWKVIPGFERYEVNHMSEIRNRATGAIMKSNKDYQVDLYAYASDEEKKGIRTPSRTYVMSLLAFFPHVKRLETVDHMDGNHDNQYLGNLQFMTRSENSSKYAKNRPKPKGANKAVIRYSEDKEDDEQVYDSINAASDATGIHSGSISRACKTGGMAGGFSWMLQDDPTQQNLPGEIWKNTKTVQSILGKRHRSQKKDNLQKIQVSNMGRVKGVNGKITIGTKERNSHYRLFTGVRIHQLVWAAFGDPQPDEKQVICHDDKIPFDADGCASNAIAHLSLGSYSDNTKMSYDHGKLSQSSRQRQVILATPHDEYGPRMLFSSQTEASRITGIFRCKIYTALKTGEPLNGYKWQRVDSTEQVSNSEDFQSAFSE